MSPSKPPPANQPEGRARPRIPFSSIISDLVRQWRPPQPPQVGSLCYTLEGPRCSLCWASRLDYPMEVEIKRRALNSYWTAAGGPPVLEELVAAPEGRFYRLVSKRRALVLRGRTVLGLVAVDHRQNFRPVQVHACAIELELHGQVFRALQASRAYPALSEHLNFAIMKGEFLILNLDRVDSYTLRLARAACKDLPRLAGALVAQGRAERGYYLETTRLRKLFGGSHLEVQVAGRSFHFPPECFGQVNRSVMEQLATTVASLIGTQGPVLDLYCGWGLLGLTATARPLVGLESNPSSVKAARDNARRLGIEARFLQAEVTPESVARHVQWREPWSVIVDPPRSGCPLEVMQTLAAAGPARIIHVFCDLERAPDDLRTWKRLGYVARRAIPLDMFAGTDELELVVLLEPQGGEAVGAKERAQGPTNPAGPEKRPHHRQRRRSR